ncbi:hypothetical protein CLU79DRAFT_213519 [Phycomyces nitens]|nr:hypothetical protein CLU79DRAFT_213519 [Phycomyces nitens]
MVALTESFFNKRKETSWRIHKRIQHQARTGPIRGSNTKAMDRLIQLMHTTVTQPKHQSNRPTIKAIIKMLRTNHHHQEAIRVRQLRHHNQHTTIHMHTLKNTQTIMPKRTIRNNRLPCIVDLTMLTHKQVVTLIHTIHLNK